MAATAVDTRDLLRAVRDPCEFARVLCGAPLWDHQASVARSKARYRVICAGRQVGKSRLLAVLALHQAFSVPGSLTLIVSAGEDAAKRLLAECASLVTAPLLATSVVEDQSALMVLTNGSDQVRPGVAEADPRQRR